MIQIDDPDPGALPDHSCTGFAVPLNLPEILISFFRGQCLPGSFQITIGNFAHVAFGIVVVIQQCALALVQEIGFRGVRGTPAHHDGFGEHFQADFIPAETLGNDVDTHFLQQFHAGQQNCLPGRIPGGIHAGELRLKAVLFHNAVTVSVCPTSFTEKLLCVVYIGFDLHSGVVPGHTVVFRVRRGCIAVQCHIRNQTTVNGIGDCLADFHVAGNVVTNGCSVLSYLTFCGKHGKGESAAVGSGNSFNVIAVNLVHSQGRRGDGCIYLSCLDSSQSGVFAHEDDDHILNGRNFAIIVFIGFQNQLFLAAPLHELIRAGSNSRVRSVIFGIGMFGNHTDRSQGIQEPEGGRVQRDDHGKIIFRHGTVHKSQINRTHGGLCRFQCEGHILCRDLLTVGEVSILPDFEGPHQAVLGQAIVGSQIIDKRHVRIVSDQGTLHNGSVSMAPALGGIQSCGLIANGNNDCVSDFFRCCFCNRCFFCSAGCQTDYHDHH